MHPQPVYIIMHVSYVIQLHAYGALRHHLLSSLLNIHEHKSGMCFAQSTVRRLALEKKIKMARLDPPSPRDHLHCLRFNVLSIDFVRVTN